MNKSVVAFITVLGPWMAVSSCSNRSADRAAEDAQERYEMVAQSGTLDDLCAASQASAAAWLQVKDRAHYHLAATRAQFDCNLAKKEGGDLSANADFREKEKQERANELLFKQKKGDLSDR
jgi:hypothetical protein